MLQNFRPDQYKAIEILSYQKIKIRTAEKKDIDFLYLLANQLSTAVTVEKSALECHIDYLVKDERHQILIAEQNGAVVGYLSGYVHTAIYANGKVAYIDEIVVSSENRSKGIGTELLLEFERLAKLQNCILVSLATAGAKEFYERAGYVSTASYFKKYL